MTITIQSTAPAAVTSSEEPAEQPLVLLVDDQPGRLLAYEAMLGGLGVGCVKAGSGAKALERVLQQAFALILLDVNMPEMDGFEVARLVRQHPRFGATPIIFVTAGHASDMELLRGYQLGAIDYISMPVAPEVLRSKVAVLVEMHRKRSELEALNRELDSARRQVVHGAEMEIRASEARFRALANNIDQLAWTCDQLGHADWYNDRWYAYTGTSAAQMLGDGWKAVVEPKHLERVMASLQRSLATGTAWEDTFPLRGKDGRYHWFLSRAVPIRDADGRIVQWCGTNTDVSELKALKSALEDGDRRKDEFLAMLAHELRNPVAPIRTAAETLALLSNGDARKRALIDVIQRQSGTLARILDDLLDVARITRGRIELQPELVPVAACVEAALQTTAPLMRDKGHRVHVSHARDALHVRADRVRLEQCMTNLLTNAAKFTDAGGEIDVRVHADGHDAVIDVRDNGVGIAPAFAPHVFDLFSQSARSIDRSQGGLGLGLAICRQLIELHGGSVRCTSDGEGRGATFTLRLPLAPAAPDAAPALQPAAAVQPKRVLVVDDNCDAADTLAMWLEAHGHATRTAYGAEAALDAVDGFVPDVVLLDLGLPGMDGYEVARRIKRVHRSMRVVALSGYGQPRDKLMSAAAGFDAHAVKPVDMAELDQLLGR
jgi:PAS domain S-box-containing protein